MELTDIKKAQFIEDFRAAEVLGREVEFLKSHGLNMEDFEKGGVATIGEVRDWGGVKYKKIAPGKWEEYREIRSTGGVSIGSNKLTATQTSVEESKKQDLREAAKRMAKEDKKEKAKRLAAELKKEKIWDEIEDEIHELRINLRDAKSRRRILESDMEEEVGAAEEKDKDKVGNEYGGMLNDIDEEILELRNEISAKEKEMEKIYEG